MRIHIIPKYEYARELASTLNEICSHPPTASFYDDFSLISCNIKGIDNDFPLSSQKVKKADESAFDEFKYNLRQKIAGMAYAITVTTTKEIDAYLKELDEAKKAPIESLIEHNDTIDRVLLLEEPTGVISGDISYISLTRNGGKDMHSSYLLQKLNPKSASSQHKHEPTPEFPNATAKKENHIVLFGESEEMADIGFVKLVVGDMSLKRPGVAHMIRNNDNFIAARNLVVIAPAGNGRDDKVETNHLEWPD